ncbi:hypothetical protein LJC33_06360 [Eubacteriales bacterium OttesenSCG-928-N13]|nr:hypothetical protein [Eubacteriales bacterium OttesenSCG-928-N13]
MSVYYLGGGTCCGKSTVTELLCKKYGLRLFKQDDYLFDYLEQLAKAGHDIAVKQSDQSMEETWLGSDAIKMCDEEMQLYAAMLPLSQTAIATLPGQGDILAEGVGFLPNLMHDAGVDKRHYACMIPTPVFRLDEYAKRPWISHFLKDVSDKDAAFKNWMERDARLSDAAFAQAQSFGYSTYVVDGSVPIEHTVCFLEKVFGLE